MTEQGSEGRAVDFLSGLATQTRRSFEENRRLMSFAEYVALVVEQPQRYARNAAHYLRDCFDHFGRVERQQPWGATTTHFRLFDCPFDEGRDRVVGQEAAQEAVYRVLTSFVQDGRVQRMILLHGPNGSAKSSLINCMQRALEAYSHTDEGALYRFNWVFPADKIARQGIGFGGRGEHPRVGRTDTYAYLDDIDIDARIGCELKDNPLLVIPREARVRLLEDAMASAGVTFTLPDVMRRGELSHKSKQIYEALLASYHGDLAMVLRHIQVERFYISRRYRVGAVTVDPQLRVDAGARQVTADRSLQALPSSLQNQALFELFGDLVDGNRGVVEFNDFLKRPQEFNRYLLSTSEKGTVALDHSIVHLDAILVGSANETYLSAFKGSPEYPSFNARLELVRMPYLRDYKVEQRIYDEQITSAELGKPIAPHATCVAALWAVLTRLYKPQPEHYPESLRAAIGAMTPLEKADLYATGRVPHGLTAEQARELRALVGDMLDEASEGVDYEGLYGASPREMKALILRASQNPRYPHLSPLAILTELRALVREVSVYKFLQMKPDDGYHHHEEFIDVVTERYLDLLDHDIRSAMGLVEEGRYEEFFVRYIDHVTHWIKGEKVFNRLSNRSEDPDEGFMKEVEAQLSGVEDARTHRNDVMASIAAWSIDNPGQKVDVVTIFPDHFEALKDAYFDERREQIKRIEQNLLAWLEDPQVSMEPADRKQVEQTIADLQRKGGYTLESAREAIVFLMGRRYAN